MALITITATANVSASTITQDDDVIFKPTSGGTLTFDASFACRSFVADSTGGAVVLSAGGTAAVPVTIDVGKVHVGEPGTLAVPTIAGANPVPTTGLQTNLASIMPAGAFLLNIPAAITSNITLQALTTKGLVINCEGVYAQCSATATAIITIKCTQTAVVTAAGVPATTFTINGRVVTTGRRVDGPYAAGQNATLNLKGIDIKDMTANTAAGTGPFGVSGPASAYNAAFVQPGTGTGPSVFCVSGAFMNVESLRGPNSVPPILSFSQAASNGIAQTSSATSYPFTVIQGLPKGASVDWFQGNLYQRQGQGA